MINPLRILWEQRSASTDNYLALFDAFVAHLHRCGQWRLFWTPDGNTASGNESAWVPFDKPMRLPKRLRGRNMFFSVNPTATAPPEKRRRYKASLNRAGKDKEGRAQDWAVCAVNTLYAEFDAKDFVEENEWHPHYTQPDTTGLSAAKIRGELQKAQTEAIDAAYARNSEHYKVRAEIHIEQLDPQPSVIVDSGGGYHCYWLLQDTVNISDQNRMVVAHYQREWVHYVDGDKSATDLRRVLRVPGSVNRKAKYAPDYPLVDFVKFDLDLQYHYEDLIAPLPAPAQRTQTARTDTYIPENLRDCIEPQGEVPTVPLTAEVRVFNSENDLRTMLLGVGYTEEDSGRLSRPGATTGGVQVYDDNSAAIYSSSDLLFCERRIRPVDVLCVYTHGGDVDKTLAHLAELYAERQQQFADYLAWLMTPAAIATLKEADFKNAERARKLLSVIVERCTQDLRVSITPGYDYLALQSGIAKGGLSGYLARLFTAGFIDIRPGGEGKPTAITLVFHNLNSSSKGADTTVQVVKNWNYYRKYRPDELFIRNHYAYNCTRVNAGLKPLGDNALPVIGALVDGPLTTKEAAGETGHSYQACARVFRRAVEHDIVDVDVGYRGLKTYTLKPEWESILQRNRVRTTTYGVGVQRRRRYLQSRIAYMERKAPERVPQLKEDQRRLDRLWRKIVDEAGIIPYRKPPDARRRRLAKLVAAGERAENRPPPVDMSEGAKWRRWEYAKSKQQAGAEWKAFLAWAIEKERPIWWMGETEILGQFRLFELDRRQQDTAPPPQLGFT